MKKNGFAALLSLMLIAMVLMIVIFGVGLINLRNKRATNNIVLSAQSLALAEAALEDSMYRVINTDLAYSNSNTLTINGQTATMSINQVGATVTIGAQGDVDSRIKNLGIELTKNNTDASFFYGVQVGEGGLEISHGDGQVVGNVYANGTSFGSGEVTGDFIVGGDGNEVQDFDIGGNVTAYGCDNATIGGDLITHDSGSSSCNVSGSTSTQSESPEQIDFPILDTQIDSWKADAEAGGVLTGNQTISSDQTLGPIKIDGNLTLSNNVEVDLLGPVWVTGTFNAGNNAIMQLDESFGTDSGVFMADGTVNLDNNVIMRGTSEAESYLMVIGTSNSQSESSAAIDVKNNLDGAILFAPNGIMVVHNNVDLVEAMAHKLLLKKATVNYQLGLENISFSTGPAGGWTIGAWEEN